MRTLWRGQQPAGVAPFGPFSMAATRPFGVPAVFSLAFWGGVGVWGVLFALIDRLFPRGGSYWAGAFLFGAAVPSLVALLVVLPLKGQPVGGGWHLPLLATAFLINGAWGIGTALIVMLTRLVPLFPFNLQNYAYGLTGISCGAYALTSWLCMLPATVAYTFAAGALATGAAGTGRLLALFGLAGILLVLLSLMSRWLRSRRAVLDDLLGTRR